MAGNRSPVWAVDSATSRVADLAAAVSGRAAKRPGALAVLSAVLLATYRGVADLSRGATYLWADLYGGAT